jgi:hypothetical protein
MVGGWLAERLGLWIFTGVLVLTVGAVGASISRQVRADASLFPGSTQFSDICRCVVHATLASADRLNDLQLNIRPDSTIRAAFIGHFSEPGAGGVWLDNLNLGFNGSQATTINGRGGSTVVTSGSRNREARFQYWRITDQVQALGSGWYSILNTNVNWRIRYMIVIEQNPSFPRAQVVAHDFFYANDDVPTQSMQVSINLPLPIPADYTHVPGATRISVLGGSWDTPDRTIATYTMGVASGTLTNDNGTSPSRDRNFFGSALLSIVPGMSYLPNIDPTATSFTLRVQQTDAGGGSDAAAWLIFYAPLETPELPPSPIVVQTDTCYDEDE